MKLIINIPKKTFENLRQGVFITVGETFAKRLIKYIKNGTPLPKGHGDIVDIKTLINMFWDGNSMEITKYDLSVIEPIIEADKAERSEQNDK